MSTDHIVDYETEDGRTVPLIVSDRGEDGTISGWVFDVHEFRRVVVPPSDDPHPEQDHQEQDHQEQESTP